MLNHDTGVISPEGGLAVKEERVPPSCWQQARMTVVCSGGCDDDSDDRDGDYGGGGGDGRDEDGWMVTLSVSRGPSAFSSPLTSSPLTGGRYRSRRHPTEARRRHPRLVQRWHGHVQEAERLRDYHGPSARRNHDLS